MCGNDCQAKKKNTISRPYGLFSSLLLLLIPKCPFCFVAFSSALLICGDQGIEHSSRYFYSDITLILTALFTTAALLNILFNYRRGKSLYSLIVAGLGSIAIILSVTIGGGLPLYYSGTFLVLSGVLWNTGLWSLVGRVRSLRKKPAF